MKKIILLLALIMVFVTAIFADPTDFSAEYEQASKLYVQEYTIAGGQRFGVKIGTVTIKFGPNYDGNQYLKLANNIENLALSGPKNVNGGSGTFTGSGQQYMKVDGEWIQYNAGGSIYPFKTVGKNMTVVIEFYFSIGYWENPYLVEGATYSIVETSNDVFRFELDNQNGLWSSSATVLVPVKTANGTGDPSQNSLFGDNVDTGDVVFGDPEPENPILYTKVEEETTYDLGSLDYEDVATIKAWGSNVSEDLSLLVKISHSSTKNAFELTHSTSTDTIPYSLYVNGGSTKVVSGVAIDPKPTIGKDNKAEESAKTILAIQAKLDITEAQKTSKPAGTYTDTIYIEISLDS